MPLKHISEKRLAANRANAGKSTGPRTEAGKAIVSANGCRTRAYARVHRMPPQIEAHFRSRAEERSQAIADPARRALHYDWWMLDGHRILHERRERALFNAGLEYGQGDEKVATEWVLRQSGYIQALNRYAGWIQARLRKVEQALQAQPEKLAAEFDLTRQPDPARPTPAPTSASAPIQPESVPSEPTPVQGEASPKSPKPESLADQTHSTSETNPS
ncbi:MAG: hypothetical protein J0H49_00300, partial [Acidobacteria bacterium]|nr:hypothetical protein [Acidobacteriota bacterium]